MILIYAVVIAYCIAVNIYGFFLVKSQKDNAEGAHAEDGKLFAAGLLGGAIAVYAALFVYRYRLKSMLLMLGLPVLAVVNVYVAIVFLRFGGSFLV